MLRQYESSGFKTIVSNDYDHIIEQLIEYFKDVRIKCSSLYIYHFSTVIDFSSEKYSGSTGHRNSWYL